MHLSELPLPLHMPAHFSSDFLGTAAPWAPQWFLVSEPLTWQHMTTVSDSGCSGTCEIIIVNLSCQLLLAAPFLGLLGVYQVIKPLPVPDKKLHCSCKAPS